jgi:hypothetical protein
MLAAAVFFAVDRQTDSSVVGIQPRGFGVRQDLAKYFRAAVLACVM